MLQAGTEADPQDEYLAKCERGRGHLPLHEDSAWDSFDPKHAWSASASSLVTTSELSSKTICDTHTHSGDQLLAISHSVAGTHKNDVSIRCMQHNEQQDEGKESKMSKFLHWLTDPNSRDVRWSQKTGLPVKKGSFHTLANATGRCPV